MVFDQEFFTAFRGELKRKEVAVGDSVHSELEPTSCVQTGTSPRRHPGVSLEYLAKNQTSDSSTSQSTSLIVRGS